MLDPPNVDGLDHPVIGELGHRLGARNELIPALLLILSGSVINMDNVRQAEANTHRRLRTD